MYEPDDVADSPRVHIAEPAGLFEHPHVAVRMPLDPSPYFLTASDAEQLASDLLAAVRTLMEG